MFSMGIGFVDASCLNAGVPSPIICHFDEQSVTVQHYVGKQFLHSARAFST